MPLYCFKENELSENFAADRIARITENRERLELAAAIIEGAGLQQAHDIPVDWTKLVITEKCIHEKTGSRTLSERICGIVYPHENGGELFHYTNMKAFRGIAASGVLRLAQLSGRLGENEIRAHAEQHACDGYRGAVVEELAGDLFFTSFTRTTAANEADLWRSFGDNGFGVRLRFEIRIDRDRPHHGELRGIRYFDGTGTLLNLIDADLAAVGLPRFLPWSTSRITAFGLPEGYADEAEVRLMLKHHRGAPNHRKNEGGFDFWEAPINVDNDVASVRLLGVEAGRHADLAMVEQIVRSSAIAGTDVVRAL